jgi:hypothetical protein
MSSNPAHINPKQSEQDVSHESNGDAALEEEIVSVEQAETTSTETQTNRIDLPQPDADNITVLTDKLPNKPILPWNRYDSPWEDSETEATTEESVSETTSENQNLEAESELNTQELDNQETMTDDE